MNQNSSNKHKYKLKYWFRTESGNFTKEEIKEAYKTDQELGACDALILLSCIYPENGSYSQLLISADGRTQKEVSSNDLFKAWLLLGSKISEREDLHESKRYLAALPAQMLYEANRQ